MLVSLLTNSPLYEIISLSIEFCRLYFMDNAILVLDTKIFLTMKRGIKNMSKYKNLQTFFQGLNGKFVGVRFIKADGTIRRMNCRKGVAKYLKGGKSWHQSAENKQYISVFDVKAMDYRLINVNTIISIRSQGLIHFLNLGEDKNETFTFTQRELKI